MLDQHAGQPPIQRATLAIKHSHPSRPASITWLPVTQTMLKHKQIGCEDATHQGWLAGLWDRSHSRPSKCFVLSAVQTGQLSFTMHINVCLVAACGSVSHAIGPQCLSLLIMHLPDVDVCRAADWRLMYEILCIRYLDSTLHQYKETDTSAQC